MRESENKMKELKVQKRVKYIKMKHSKLLSSLSLQLKSKNYLEEKKLA